MITMGNEHKNKNKIKNKINKKKAMISFISRVPYVIHGGENLYGIFYFLQKTHGNPRKFILLGKIAYVTVFVSLLV
jgi:hypothetical protein